MKNVHQKPVFNGPGTSYFLNLRLFPKSVRDDVYKLYSFVRFVDDLVRQDSPDLKTLNYLNRRWSVLKKNLGKDMKKADGSTAEYVLANICYIMHRYECDIMWVDDFLDSMINIDKVQFETISDLFDYMHGSVEGIGSILAKILRLSDATSDYVVWQSRALQLIGLIMDIGQDSELGRCYFPQEDLVMFGLKDLSFHEASRKPAEFREFIEFQVARYYQWQKLAKKGLRYIPKRSRIAVRTTIDMYDWIGRMIADEPMLVFEARIKPSRTRILRTRIKRTIYG